MKSAREAFAHQRSILEVPITNDIYWPKIPSFQTDGIMLDLEDSVPPEMKTAAREKVLEICGTPDVLRGKTTIVRVNNLSTSWGADDLRVLGKHAGELIICYPKVESVEELAEAASITAKYGQPRFFHVMIESYRGLKAVDKILATDCVVGVHFGYIDYGLDVGCQIFSASGDDLFTPAMTVPRARIAAAAASRKIFSTGGSLIPDFRDLAKVARFVTSWRDSGYSACIALSPRHLEVVNEYIRPSAGEIANAQRIIESAPQDPAVTFLDRKLADQILRQHRGY